MKNFECLIETISKLFPRSSAAKVNSRKLMNKIKSFRDRKIHFITNDILTTFFLSVINYILFLEKAESQIKKEKHYSKALQIELNAVTTSICSVAYNLEFKIPLRFRKQIRNLFREAIKKYIYQSKLLKRFYEKPLGYPGDYMMFEMLYNERPISEGLGYYFDIFVLDYLFTRSIINRKNKMKSILKELINGSNLRILNILNIGCGSCREVRELFSENTFFNKKLNFSFIDQDTEALKFAKLNLVSTSNNIRMHFLKNSSLEMLGLGSNRKKTEINNQDIIYSMGVVDYFLDNMFEHFIRHCYSSLKPGGKLIIASCNADIPEIFLALRWFCEWNFYGRDAFKIKNLLVKHIGINSAKVIWEKNKQIFFIIINKESHI